MRSAVEDASVFYVTGDFDGWKNVCSSEFAAFVSAVSCCCILKVVVTTPGSRGKDYTEWNRANRQTQIDRRAGTSRNESGGSVVAKPKKTAASGSKGGGGSSSKGGPSKAGNKKKPAKNNADRGVYHNLNRSSGK